MTSFYMYKHKLKKEVILGILLALFIYPPLSSEAQTIDPKFQSVFIYGIARKVQWSGDSDNFTIGLIGKGGSLLRELENLTTSKTIYGKPVKIEQLSNATGELKMNIVFVAGGNTALLKSALSNASMNTLVMSASPDGLANGSYLNFVQKGNKITFELNETEIKKTNLRIATDLIRLASIVK